MLGNFSSYSQPSAAVYPWFRFWEFDVYAQDSWKVTQRLTLEYGVRFVHMTPTYTVMRGGTPGGEGTWTLYSVDPSQYNAAQKPTINLSNGFCRRSHDRAETAGADLRPLLRHGSRILSG